MPCAERERCSICGASPADAKGAWTAAHLEGGKGGPDAMYSDCAYSCTKSMEGASEKVATMRETEGARNARRWSAEAGSAIAGLGMR